MDLNLFGLSPSSIIFGDSSLLNYKKRTPPSNENNDDRKKGLLTLAEFVSEVPEKIQLRKVQSIPAGTKDDPVMKLFHRLGVNDHNAWKDFVYFDNQRAYTRNLIATDGTTYTLLLLCWNPGKFSPIHDHPCDGCWMRILEGQVQECRYRQEIDGVDSKLICTHDQTFDQGGCVFINDSIGYHKIGNPSSSTPAITLHLYSPPFQRCKIWLNENHKPSQSKICHYSEYGTKVE